MTIKTLTKDQWREFVGNLIEATRVIGVQQKEKGFFTFSKLTNVDDLRLDYDVTYISPRKFFQPPRETLLKFTTSPTVDVKEVMEVEPFVLVGVHPYDLKALNQMDVIHEKDNPDTNYMLRRRAATIIASDPQAANRWSFWPWMNAATVNTGYDLFITDIGGCYVVEVGTEKGKKLLETHASFADANAKDIAKRAAIRAGFKKMFDKNRWVDVPYDKIPTLITGNADHPLWAEKAKKCYSCGTCNQVCPTCYCFDVREEVDLTMKGGVRTRYWDGCLLEDFAVIGSGENFREKREDRFRHRIFRKTTYVPQMIGGELACVGCGRCSAGCLPDIADPVKIFNELAEEK